MPVMMRRRPIAMGETMAWAGLISAGSGGAMWIETLPADQFQPRLVAGPACLIATLET